MPTSTKNSRRLPIAEYCITKEFSPDNIQDLRDYVLKSRFGFHNDEVSDEEWVVSDYALEDDIVERFVTLTSLIVKNKECTIVVLLT